MEDTFKEEVTWSFDAAIKLLHLPLTVDRPTSSARPVSTISTSLETYGDNTQDEQFATSLGDFDQLWKELGLSTTGSSPPIPPLTSDDGSLSSNEDPSRHISDVKYIHYVNDVEPLHPILLNIADSVIGKEPPTTITKPLTAKKPHRKDNIVKTRNYKKLAPQGSDIELSLEESIFSTESKKKKARKFQQSNNTEPADSLPTRSNPIPENPQSLQHATTTFDTLVGRFHAIDHSRLIHNGLQKQHLLHELFNRFELDRSTLFGYTLHPYAPTDPTGVHIFIDMSNILIGFHDSIKKLLDIPKSTRLTRKILSFHNLSLILERGRPTAKRVIVGSDNVDSIKEAELIGYETNILEKVVKAKPLSPSKLRHRSANGALSSSSESSLPTHGPMKRVEQGVDEILHLKMCESIIDAEIPSTMVLATGDAAQAEYSAGFLKMVERALQRGGKLKLSLFDRIQPLPTEIVSGRQDGLHRSEPLSWMTIRDTCGCNIEATMLRLRVCASEEGEWN